MRIVIDTNVLVSAVSGGASPEILDLLKSNHFTLIGCSTEIFNECSNVLNRPKFNLPRKVVDDIMLYLCQISTLAVPDEAVDIIPDESDNRFLEATTSGKANFIVKGQGFQGFSRALKPRGLRIIVQGSVGGGRGP